MQLTKPDICARFKTWLIAWDEYDLETVMDWMHEEVVFENWDGLTVNGKAALQKIWTPWFIFNGNFKFISEAEVVDEAAQQIAFQWRYEGPSFEKEYKGKQEIRRGTDIISLLEGKIVRKTSYSKTCIQIEAQPLILGVKK